jgi:hypothetical protein
MLRKTSVRFFAVALAAGSLSMIPLSSPSGAAGKVSCTKESSGAPVTAGGKTTVKATLSGCVNLAPSATSVSMIAAKTTAKTTWANGKGTTLQSVKYAVASTQGKCGPKATTAHYIITATTTGGTGAALKAIPKGSVGKSSVCVNKKTSKGTLEPGTKSTF